MEARQFNEEGFELQKERNRLESEILEMRNALKSSDWNGIASDERDTEELEAQIMQYTSRLVNENQSA
jgi:hypothetical protein